MLKLKYFKMYSNIEGDNLFKSNKAFNLVFILIAVSLGAKVSGSEDAPFCLPPSAVGVLKPNISCNANMNVKISFGADLNQDGALIVPDKDFYDSSKGCYNPVQQGDYYHFVIKMEWANEIGPDAASKLKVKSYQADYEGDWQNLDLTNSPIDKDGTYVTSPGGAACSLSLSNCEFNKYKLATHTVTVHYKLTNREIQKYQNKSFVVGLKTTDTESHLAPYKICPIAEASIKIAKSALDTSVSSEGLWSKVESCVLKPAWLSYDTLKACVADKGQTFDMNAIVELLLTKSPLGTTDKVNLRQIIDCYKNKHGDLNTRNNWIMQINGKSAVDANLTLLNMIKSGYPDYADARNLSMSFWVPDSNSNSNDSCKVINAQGKFVPTGGSSAKFGTYVDGQAKEIEVGSATDPNDPVGRCIFANFANVNVNCYRVQTLKDLGYLK